MWDEALNAGSSAQSARKSNDPIQWEDIVKKTSLLAVLMLITLIGAGTNSFAAACSATSLSSAAGGGVWGIEAYGQGPSGLDNILIQATFSSGGTFSGTEWQSVAGTLSTFAISGTWAMVSPATDCQGTITVTSPSTQTFSFALNNGAAGGVLTQTDLGYTIAGIMAAEGKVTCSATTLKKKKLSLYSYGQIPAVGGLVTGSGEILFGSTGATFSSAPTVTLDLGGAGNFTIGATGTATISSNCTGSGTLVATALGQTFDVDLVIVDGGKESYWIVTNSGDNVTGYFLE